MKTGLSNDEMARIRAALEAVPAVEKAVLFGSRAMGLARSNSDVDILLYGDALQTRDVLRVASLLEATTLPYQFDLIRDDTNNAPLLEHVKRYGKVIFQRQEISSRSKSSRKSLGMVSERLFSSIPSEWEYKMLGEACAEGGGDIQTGPFGSQLHASDYVQIGIPSIMPQNIGDNRFDENGIARITPEDAQRLNRYLVRTGDIVYSRRGDVERRALVRTHENGWLCGTGCLRVRLGEKGADSQFVSYYLGHPSVREWISRHAHGATMPNLNTSILGECPFLEPPIKEQRAIAHILGTLDDKIELNRRMSETLEAMARALFKAWFVDFEPVRAKMSGRWRRGQSLPGLPAHLYDLFPDRLVESELGEIPEGWSISNIKNLTSNIQYGLTQSASKIKCGPHFLRITDIQGGRINWDNVPFCQVTSQEYAKYRIQRGDIFIARTGASTGENVYITSAPDSVFASYLVRFQFYDFAVGRYVGFFMRTHSYFDFVVNNLGGSAQPNANAQTLSMAELVYPNHDVLVSFLHVVDGMDNTITKNDEETRILTEVC